MFENSPIASSLGVDVSETQQFIMDFYESQMSAGHLMSDIDKQDLIPYMEMIVYKTVKKYVETLASIDSGGGGIAGSL